MQTVTRQVGLRETDQVVFCKVSSRSVATQASDQRNVSRPMIMQVAPPILSRVATDAISNVTSTFYNINVSLFMWICSRINMSVKNMRIVGITPQPRQGGHRPGNCQMRQSSHRVRKRSFFQRNAKVTRSQEPTMYARIRVATLSYMSTTLLDLKSLVATCVGSLWHLAHLSPHVALDFHTHVHDLPT